MANHHGILGLSLAFALALPVSQAFASCVQPSNTRAIQSEFETWVNTQRQAKGLSRLKISSALTSSAKGHACEMAAYDYLDHAGKRGSTLTTRVKKQGYRLKTAVENIARSSTQPSAATAVRLWEKSPNHRFNLFYPDLQDMGLGVAVKDGMTYYVFVGARS